jgi:methionine-rich copper-binding protein CopC
MTIMRTIAGRALRLCFFAGFLVSTAAFAHAHLQQQTPAADSTVAASPESLTLSFSEGIETAFSAVTLTGPQQKAVATGKLARSDSNKAQLIVPLTQPLAAGSIPLTGTWSPLMATKPKGNTTLP